ncbi:MAG TPA: carbamoyl-phosphate synthase large subunit [Leptospiraceae bacterium]|nr:carbamoyl-phosphate synthase large subunit [Leptospiraceae bacterium]HMX31425.1 carbamoyl-phosphate synthase large subunit [Leptospiraceae bacterium]HMY30936.1 carbamoyl-phosphate synthase large subunit [Leptospiraceae bacterium]HMZ63347.1 carbamoyl-phosphate synthase large subunit [Leptospiraceae bacterium]HNA05576.1 carbamoyl-phosphate synthase large subunit [Leptospiraceae bacterium]
MPQRKDISSVLIIGSGPIVIGQACEFDYSGTQAAKALKEKGLRTILVNSNPATIMTDPMLADATYIEPLTVSVLTKIIEKEKPDALLPTVGGQTALNLAMSLVKEGILERYKVKLIGAQAEAIKKAEDRDLFKQVMVSIGMNVPKSGLATNMEEARKIKEQVGIPLIIRPAFTLAGTGGGHCTREEDFEEVAMKGLNASPISQILIEESVIGWKEYELEVMRDNADNVVIICSIENIDPMGVHTGDSITVAPQQTLSDKEYQKMRDMALKIIREIGVETGGSNIQFAVNPKNGEIIVIEMNPRVSRSSALASKATGFPIAKIAALLAIGLSLDEIKNDITRVTPASFEPSIDYVVTKIPRFAFEKFPGADSTLGVQMKAVGESMAIGRTFKESFQKALRSLENDRFGFGSDGYLKELIEFHRVPDSEKKAFITKAIKVPTDKRIFNLKLAFNAGFTVEEIASITGMEPWFLRQMEDIHKSEAEFIEKGYSVIRKMKTFGFSNRQLAYLSSKKEIESIISSGSVVSKIKSQVNSILAKKEKEIEEYLNQEKTFPVYKRIDTCAGEFEAYTPYFYSSYDTEDESNVTTTKSVMILGGGPNRIGQGIEFDYCCCHASYALQDMGVESIMVNSNPETVSTDYDTSDRLYFEPLSLEDVMNIYRNEKPIGVIVQFGGQTPLKLATELEKRGVPILGTSPDSIDRAEDRKRFVEVLQKLGLKQPANGMASTREDARRIASEISYPVLVRPSYVLGGRAMAIINDTAGLDKYMDEAEEISEDRPILIDSFLDSAVEVDVDALCDSETVFIAGIMEHIEEAGVHSGDSACMLPPQNISDKILSEIKAATRALALELKVKGLINIQFAIKDETLYILEVNPRASRTVPFVSKAIGIPIVKYATMIMLGKKLKELIPQEEYSVKLVNVKEAVLPFNKFPGVDTILGPEMRSTGEVMGIASTAGEAYLKAQIMAGEETPKGGTIFVSINDKTKPELLPYIVKLSKLGYNLLATKGTHKLLSDNGVISSVINKLHEGFPNVVDFIKEKKINLIINTPLSRVTRDEAFAIRQAAIKYRVPCLTTAEAAKALVDGLLEMGNKGFTIRSLQEIHK